MIVIAIVLWWFIGVAINIATLLSITNTLTTKDCIFAVLCGVLGVLAIFWFLSYADNDFMNKVIYRRK